MRKSPGQMAGGFLHPMFRNPRSVSAQKGRRQKPAPFLLNCQTVLFRSSHQLWVRWYSSISMMPATIISAVTG